MAAAKLRISYPHMTKTLCVCGNAYPAASGDSLGARLLTARRAQ